MPLDTSLGQRLREERIRVGRTQLELAEIGGVKRTTQHLYESDVRHPDLKYIERIGTAGIDVVYVAFGTRTPVATAQSLHLTHHTFETAFLAVDEFAVDELGNPWPKEMRMRLLLLLCASMSGRGDADADLTHLTEAMSRLTGK